jgi:hypothetical protein
MYTIANNVRRNAVATQRATALLVDQVVVSATPVLTGRARSNWLVGLGSPVRRVVETLGNAALSASISAARARINSSKEGETIWLSNNLSYIQRLNQGSSAQAPAGFVERAVETARVALRRRLRILQDRPVA